uniref:Uncharacterized protein n=1 Tax=Arundo donax TaxID=35708 RepID=A0A0A9FHB4_ARUDO
MATTPSARATFMRMSILPFLMSKM